MANLNTSNPSCGEKECDCRDQASVDRRQFLAFSGAAAASSQLPLMAGPFDSSSDQDSPIPLNKKLDPNWIKSLTQRGTPTVYSGWNQLRHIGMPIGGIGSGTVYLGGDGKLWCWDIFNEHHEGCVPNRVDARNDKTFGTIVRERDGANYVQPTDDQNSPWSIGQGFVLNVRGHQFSLDRNGFEQVTFCGQYPIATVNYQDSHCPVDVELEAYSPFIPLDADRSSYPATVMQFRVTNSSDSKLDVSLVGYLENAALHRTTDRPRCNKRLIPLAGRGVIGDVFEVDLNSERLEVRDDIVFEDFEREDWGEWLAEGKAFAGGPFPVEATRATGQNSQGHSGKFIVNSYNSRDVAGGGNPDNHMGTLTSPEFLITRRYVNVAIAGGNNRSGIFCEVIVDGNSIGRVTGHGNNILVNKSIDVSRYEGKKARIRIVDQVQGSWAQLAADKIVFSDTLAKEFTPVSELPDFGSIALSTADQQATKIGQWDSETQSVIPFEGKSKTDRLNATQIGGVEMVKTIEAGETKQFTFVVGWYFPNTHFRRKRWYAKRYGNAGEVVNDVIENLPELQRVTRLWRDNWYGDDHSESETGGENTHSQLPHWLLERALITVNALQTNTSYRFDNGEFWAWEGVGCCPGTCTHVWHYAQAVGRLFPELERDLRERTDFGKGFRDDGRIDFRGGQAGRDATDGQAGVILRTLREHQMSTDTSFLKRVWPNCKKALRFLVAQDARDGLPDGIPVGEQHNTLDAEWFGKIPVLTSLYLAALKAGKTMAEIVGDDEAANQFGRILDRGAKNILTLFDSNFGYFVQREDPQHADAIGIGNGCYIDQTMGQWWAFNLGLGRLYDGKAIRKSLNRLWDHNFCPDMGRLRSSIKSAATRGRPYALAGDAGLIMCTWPHGGKKDDWEKHWQFGYFNECMTGFEYQAAAHMIWESKWEPSLIEKGLAVTRAIHDRYHGSMRNPYNEIECSDHYARAMASFSVFQALTGFVGDGPAQKISFDPRFSPDDLTAPFITSAAWGRVSQLRTDTSQTFSIEPVYGTIDLRQFSLAVPKGKSLRSAKVRKNGKSIPCRAKQVGQSAAIDFDVVELVENEKLDATLHLT